MCCTLVSYTMYVLTFLPTGELLQTPYLLYSDGFGAKAYCDIDASEYNAYFRLRVPSQVFTCLRSEGLPL